jgi:hypothetical protein
MRSLPTQRIYTCVHMHMYVSVRVCVYVSEHLVCVYTHARMPLTVWYARMHVCMYAHTKRDLRTSTDSARELTGLYTRDMNALSAYVCSFSSSSQRAARVDRGFRLVVKCMLLYAYQ